MWFAIAKISNAAKTPLMVSDPTFPTRLMAKLLVCLLSWSLPLSATQISLDELTANTSSLNIPRVKAGVFILCDTTVNNTQTDCSPTADRSDIVKFTDVIIGGVNKTNVKLISDLTEGELADRAADLDISTAILLGLTFAQLENTFSSVNLYDPGFNEPGVGIDPANNSAITYKICSDPAPASPERVCSIQCSCSVPEPSTWLLLATSTLGLLGYGWRQRKNGKNSFRHE